MPKAKIKNDGLLDSWGRHNRKIPDKECECCGKLFRPVDSKKRTCSRKCGYKIRKLNPHNKDKGEGWIDSKGYKQIKVNGKNVREHRFIIENILGRELLTHEDVHHNDENKLNNNPENLNILIHGEHSKYHNLKRQYAKGYKLNLSESERKRRSDFMRAMRKAKRN